MLEYSANQFKPKSCIPNMRKTIFYYYNSELLVGKTKQQFTVQVNLKIE